MQVYPGHEGASNMGKLITVVGNSGVGKTTLVQRLCALMDWQPALEQHARRPFQQLFAADLMRYGLANQVDYLLLRCEQEQFARTGEGIAIHDGGLDLDYHGFAQLFRRKGYLSDAEFGLCERLYKLARSYLPSPDVIVYLYAPPWLAAQRYQARSRSVEITQVEDLVLLGELIEHWMASVPQSQLLRVDAGAAEFGSEQSIAAIAQAIGERLG